MTSKTPVKTPREIKIELKEEVLSLWKRRSLQERLQELEGQNKLGKKV
jgi:hypothetical protein